ncbi:MAG: ribonucleotide-diphosphate reductase subunit alpha [Syntrophorhabdus sp. PtaU1.Bin153]|nr:MAG: ribonucleotide-diphosphate reductase subunit alpha [Syntrophorhabdus sp. PtaU1.Bin153]
MNPKTKKQKAKNASSKPDRCTEYARSVVSGAIIAGPYVRGACQRHLNDLEHAGERGFYYDEHEASEAIAFFEECLCLNGGQFEGLPFILFPWQSFIVGSLFGWKRKIDGMRRFRVAFIETPKGPLALDTPIATTKGWTTMGEIRSGDMVFNSDGKPTAVIGVSPIFYDHPCYRLRFSDGAEIIADAEHEWFVSSLRNGKRPGPRNDAKIGEYEKRNTSYIAKTVKMPESVSKHPQPRWNHRIDVAPALDLPDCDLPLPPYSLGAWLGDGNSDDARLTVAYSDWQIVDEIKSEGIQAQERAKHSGTTARIVLGGNRAQAARNKSFQAKLRKLDLLGNKHIPDEYFRAGTKQRLALLQGIMDTDGHVGKKGHCEITLCNKRLTVDVAALLRTLGYKCAIKESAAMLDGKEVGRRWRISFQAYRSQVPVRLLRKTMNLIDEPKTRALSRGRMIVACDPVDSVPVRCITVESDDHMFLAGKNLVPTCNSGKSPLAAGIGLKGLVADNEPRAEVYAAAPLSLDTPVPTVEGWKTQGTLSVGDVVFDENGKPCKVTYLSPILHERECFEVEFDDGTVIVSDADHPWKTTDTRGQKPSLYGSSIVTTSQIATSLRAPTGRLRHRINIAGALRLKEADLPIDPYTLGVWVGDGNSRRGSFCYHKEDIEIRNQIERNGHEVSSMNKQVDVRYCTVRGLRTKLRQLGLLENKHIPSAYLRASIGQRLALLQGLMDTDGTCTKTGECRFCQKEEHIARSVHELVISLGIRANMRKTVNSNGEPLWIVSFKASKEMPVFVLNRKGERQREAIDTRAKARYIRNVRPCKSVPVRCIEVDSKSHLYLVSRSHIATHNTYKDQAMVLFRDAIAFYDQSPELQKRLVASGTGEKRWSLSYPGKGSFFRPISSEKKGQSGPRPHMALLDEIHEHRDGTVIEMIRAGFKFRRQPLSFMITNSGHDKTTVCWEYHDMGVKIACELLENDEFFAYICSLDEEDLEDDLYLDDETLWPKVNPSLDAGIPGYEYIRSQIKEARGMPSKMSTVKRLCFCIWTESENPAISREAWMACQDKDYPVDILRGRRAWGGLDLSAVNDLTAFALMFEPGQDDPFWRLKVWFWIPGIGIRRKEETDHVPYIAWRDAGYINAIDRKTVDYEFVIAELVKICGPYNVQKIAFDRWKKKDFDKDLSRLGVTLPEMVEFGQGYQSMSPAIKVFETKLIEGAMRHDGNPCLTWCASNVVAVEDAAENKKYDKSRSIGRIDGIIAAVMACGILEETDDKSIYEGMTAEEIKARMAY